MPDQDQQSLAEINRRRIEESNQKLWQAVRNNPCQFILDGKSTQDLQDHVDDPEFQRKSPTIILNSKIIDEKLKILDPALAEKLKDQKWDMLSADECKTALKAGLSDHPEFYELYLSVVDDRVAHRRDFSWQYYQGDYPGDNVAAKDALADMTRTVFGRDNFGVYNAHKAGESHCKIVKLADENLDYKSLLSYPEVNFGKNRPDPEKIPGSAQDWAELVNFHEAEHFHGGQSNIDDYFRKLNEEVKVGGFGIDNTRAREIEADLSAIEALKTKVDPKAIEYWVGSRLACAVKHEYNMFASPPSFSTERDPRKGFPVLADLTASRHGTGFFLNEYLETGQVPDYFTTNHAQNSFYQKAFFEYHKQAAEIFVTRVPGATIADIMNENDKTGNRRGFFRSLPDSPPIDMLVSSVQRSMAVDPPVFNEVEMQMASTFVQRMTETLGLKPADMKADMTEIIDQNIINGALQSAPQAQQPVPPALAKPVV